MAKVRECESPTLPGCENARVQLFENARSATMRKYEITRMPNCENGKVQKFVNVRMRNCESACVPECQTATMRKRKLRECEIPRVADCENATESACVPECQIATMRKLDNANVPASVRGWDSSKCQNAKVRECENVRMRDCESVSVRKCESGYFENARIPDCNIAR